MYPDKTTILQFYKSLWVMKLSAKPLKCQILIVCSSIEHVKHNRSQNGNRPPAPPKNRRTNRAGLFSFSPPPGMLFSLQLDTNRFLFIAFFFSSWSDAPVARWLCVFSRDVGDEGYILPSTVSVHLSLKSLVDCSVCHQHFCTH